MYGLIASLFVINFAIFSFAMMSRRWLSEPVFSGSLILPPTESFSAKDQKATSGRTP